MNTTAHLTSLFLEYTRIGQCSGEAWRHPNREMDADEYISLLRRVPDGAGRRGYLALLASDEPVSPVPT